MSDWPDDIDESTTETCLERLVIAFWSFVVVLIAWAVRRWIGEADGMLSWIATAANVIGGVARLIGVFYVLGAILGPSWEIGMSEGD